MVRKHGNRICTHALDPVLSLPNLIGMQLNSYKKFLQMEEAPVDRKNVGLQGLFLSIFPIKSYDEGIELEFLSYSCAQPQHDVYTCLDRGCTYQTMLKGIFRIKSADGIKEEEVGLGMIPLMTSRGSFVINGSERVVVSQLHRSPGVFFEKEKLSNKQEVFCFKIIPVRGNWITAELDSSGLIYVHVGKRRKKRKILATTFMRALGLETTEEILSQFFEIKVVKLNKEQDVDDLIGRILAKDLVVDGELFCKSGDRLTVVLLLRALELKIKDICIVIDGDEDHPVIKMLDRDPITSYDSALKDCFRKMYPNEPATISNARAGFIRAFFDPKRYTLGDIGRYKMNKKLGKDLSAAVIETKTLLSRDDFVDSLKYLIGLYMGDANCKLDHIDSLTNRRIRTVGELVYTHALMGALKMEKLASDRMNMLDTTNMSITPSKLLSVKVLTGAIKDFFSRSQLSQYMDQANVLAETTHVRRLSTLGPGGLTRERAGFEVRDVHASHYGRICPVETPEGSGIGLIISLAVYAKINKFGFIDTPYQVVQSGHIMNEVVYLSADEEEGLYIAQRDKYLDIDSEGNILSSKCLVRHNGGVLSVSPDQVTHIDVMAGQMLSVAASCIPFLEHDDTNRTLMGANMQRQAVPLLIPEVPIVGTGMEEAIVKTSGAVVIAEESGIVKYVDGHQIILANTHAQETCYKLRKFCRSNNGTSINHEPIVNVGDKVVKGDILSNSSDIYKGELALGKNICVAFMPWFGYNFEDAIIVSEKLLKTDAYTSLHIEECEVMARETKLGKEEITPDIPGVSEAVLKTLDDEGIIKIGTYVKAGDLLVGKVTPKTESDVVSEERLLRVIFGEKAVDVKVSSLLVPVGIEGVVVDVKVFCRKDKVDVGEDIVLESAQVKDVQTLYKQELVKLKHKTGDLLRALLFNEEAPEMLALRTTGKTVIDKGVPFTDSHISAVMSVSFHDLLDLEIPLYIRLKELLREYAIGKEDLDSKYKQHLLSIRKGDYHLNNGVLKQVKVYIACKKPLEVGDKMAGRHGNKGVVSYIASEQDMPFMKDGQTVDMIINTLGVPPRMNIGQIAEAHLGWLGALRGETFLCPTFQGIKESVFWELFDKEKLSNDGKVELFNGHTGAQFESPVLVGILYMLKLAHLVSDKMHARSVGPYSFITRQPLGGRARDGGQRFGEMEVWAAQSYGAAKFLQEMLTVKSDDIEGRNKAYQNIVKGVNVLECGIPESWCVVMREMQGLCLDVKAEYEDVAETDILYPKVSN